MLHRLTFYSFGDQNPKTTVLAGLVSSGDFRAESISLPFSAPRRHLLSLACVLLHIAPISNLLLPVSSPNHPSLLPPPCKEPCESFGSTWTTQDNLPTSGPLVTFTVSFTTSGAISTGSRNEEHLWGAIIRFTTRLLQM